MSRVSPVDGFSKSQPVGVLGQGEDIRTLSYVLQLSEKLFRKEIVFFHHAAVITVCGFVLALPALGALSIVESAVLNQTSLWSLGDIFTVSLHDNVYERRRIYIETFQGRELATTIVTGAFIYQYINSAGAVGTTRFSWRIFLQLNAILAMAWVLLLWVLGASNDWTYGPALLAAIGPICSVPPVIVCTISQVRARWVAVFTRRFCRKVLVICVVACSATMAATASIVYVAIALNVAGTAWVDFGIMGFLYPCISFGSRMLITRACVSACLLLFIANSKI